MHAVEPPVAIRRDCHAGNIAQCVGLGRFQQVHGATVQHGQAALTGDHHFRAGKHRGGDAGHGCVVVY
jgi:hypothetical protein